MNFQIEKGSLPKKIAEALSEYIKKHGSPPPMLESIEVVVRGDVVVVDLFTVGETE